MDPVAQPPEPLEPAAPQPVAPMSRPTRRRFLGIAALGAAGAALAAAGVSLLRGASNTVSAIVRALPTPSTRLPPPPVDPAATLPGLATLITPTDEFFRIDVARSVPVVDPSTWELIVDGDVDSPLTLTYDDVLAMPLVEVDATLSCVSNPVNGYEIGTARWTGVRLREIVGQVSPRAGVEQVFTYGLDGFSAGFPREAALHEDALLAVGMNGQSLPSEHGFPARLVVPGLYGYVSATKWLARIEFTTWSERSGYWIPRGWSRLGPVKTGSRIDVPKQGATVQAGAVTVAGMAWCPGGAPTRVDVRIDDRTWQQATLGPILSDTCWRQWWLTTELPAGRSTITARAYDATGSVQTDKVTSVDPDGATGWPSNVVDVA